MLNTLKDTKGNWSSMRLIFILAFLLVCWMFYEWRGALQVELTKEHPDYRGLSELFITMLVTFGLAFLGKVLQKKYEDK